MPTRPLGGALYFVMFIDDATRLLDLVHTNVCEPTPTRPLGGALYLVTFIDAATRNYGFIQLRKRMMDTLLS